MTAPADKRADLVRSVALSIVQDSFPQEVDVFSAVWTRFAKHAAGSREARSLGLQMLGEEEPDCHTPFVVMTVAALLESFLEQAERPSRDTVESAVRSASESFGLGGTRLDAVVHAVTPKLFRTFSLLCGADIPKGGREDDSPTQPVVFVDWLSKDGGREPGKECPAQEFEELFRESEHEMDFERMKELLAKEFDLVCDEREPGEETVYVLNGENAGAYDIKTEVGKWAAGLLLAAMDNVGKRVTHQELAVALQQKMIATGTVHKGINDFRNFYCFEIMVPEEGKDRTYKVPKSGWSFLRLRRDRNQRSALLWKWRQRTQGG